MALKPGTIKALFGKLATNVDDVARYGDDVVDIAKYSDDVAEDTARLLDYYNSNAVWHNQPYMGKYVESPILQNALQGTTGYYGGTPVTKTPSGGVLSKMFDNATPTESLYSKMDEAMLAAPELNNASKTTNFLGDAFYDYDDFGNAHLLQGYDTVNVPDLNLNNLVEDWDDGTMVVRPHENTALGRWFRQQMSKKV